MSGLFDRLSEFGPEVRAEMQRMGTQGANELANALFNGSAFVPYGTGQDTPEIEKPAQEQSMEVQQQQANEGMER